MTTKPARPVWFLAFDGFQSLDVSGPFEVFAGADQLIGECEYGARVLSLAGGVVTSESGLRIDTEPLPRRVPVGLTLVVPGGGGARRIRPGSDVAAAVARLAVVADRLVTVCTGSFVAAAAGVTAGKRVATHWAHAATMASRFPDTVVDPEPLYVRDGMLWSSAGVTAGIDLALAIVEHDHGAEMAQTIARHLVMFLRRPGGQSQFATPIWTERATTDPIRAAQLAIDAEPGGDHRLDLLARRAGMSTRHFARCFTSEVGLAPGAYVARVRVEAARRALETSDTTVDAVAGACGFGSAETMRRTFHRQLGVSPDEYRSRFRLADDSANRTPSHSIRKAQP